MPNTLFNHENIDNKQKLIPKGALWSFILITSCFAWWGLANNMTDTLLAAFKKIMSMSDFQTSWIQISFYGSYFCLALPAALFIKKYSYKSGILLGLGLFILGALLFYPASLTMNYYHFLFALYILAGGLSILETSANPYIYSMGSAATATQRLNLSQSFNPIGSIVGVVISQIFILSNLNSASANDRNLLTTEQLTQIKSEELSAIMGPYVIVAVVLIVLWILIAFTRMSSFSDDASKMNVVQTFKKLYKNHNYKWGVIAQFFYVGAQIGVWSYTIRYVMNELNINEQNAATYYTAALVLFAISRFACTALMKYLEPRKLLSILAGLAIISTLIVIFNGGYVGVYALVSISGAMSLMFPTIFGIAVSGLGEDTKIGGSGLIMAILGGAVLTALQGLVSDYFNNISYSFIIPLMCFVVIFLYGRFGNRRQNLC